MGRSLHRRRRSAQRCGVLPGLRRDRGHLPFVPADGLPASEERFRSEQLEALAGLRPHLVDVATRTPGGRVLAGTFLTVRQAIGVPRRAVAAAPFIADYAREVVRGGLVGTLVERHGVRGVTIPFEA